MDGCFQFSIFNFSTLFPFSDFFEASSRKLNGRVNENLIFLNAKSNVRKVSILQPFDFNLQQDLAIAAIWGNPEKIESLRYLH